MRQIIKIRVKMSEFKFKKMSKKELKQVELVRKFDGYRLFECHIYGNDHVSLQFNGDNYEFWISLFPTSSLVIDWLKYCWIPKLAFCAKNLVVFDHRIIEQSEYDNIERDANEFVNWLLNEKL